MNEGRPKTRPERMREPSELLKELFNGPSKRSVNKEVEKR
jgi:hypothetical protein